MPVRVLVVDDHAQWRTLLARVFRSDARFEVMGDASDGLDAIARCGDLQPDVVVLDVSMPRMDGVAAVPGIRAAAPGAAIVMFTATGSAHLAEAEQLGVDGYVFKGAGPPELLEAVWGAVERRRDHPPL